jgi:hypothetical protein
MKCLLDIVASQAVQSVSEINSFLNSTLLYQLTKQENCNFCDDLHDSMEFIDQFDVVKFLDIDKTNTSCKKCIFKFSLQVLSYL